VPHACLRGGRWLGEWKTGVGEKGGCAAIVFGVFDMFVDLGFAAPGGGWCGGWVRVEWLG
jgi:hypothetical protein